MNKQRRKQLSEISTAIDHARAELEAVADDEQTYFDDMPENLQGSERGTAAEECADELNEIHNELDELRGRVDTIADGG